MNWSEANQQYLMARLSMVREALHQHIRRNKGPERENLEKSDKNLKESLDLAMNNLNRPAALDSLCAAFCLSPFECDLLLLCAGVELDAGFAELCATAQGDSQRRFPTFSLALAALPDSHWSAITPAAPLRNWRLIEVGFADTLTNSQLRIEERALHYLTGVSGLDARLQGLVEPIRSYTELAPSHKQLANQVALAWSSPTQSTYLPIINLCGDDPAAKQAVAAAACEHLKLPLNLLRCTDVPAQVAEREALSRLWERESAFGGGALLLDCEDPDNGRAIVSFLENVRGMLFVTSHEPLRLWRRPIIRFDVMKLSPQEQKSLWQHALGPVAANLDGNLDLLVSQFDLGADAIQLASTRAISSSNGEKNVGLEPLWETCRVQARSRLNDLAQRIDSKVSWDDIVLPQAQRRILFEIAAHVRQRAKVYESWGFAAKGERGLGISALFAGVSGTGKTMAAEVLANELHLDLYRIDLSQVVSKYIGETEKNLKHVFDAAEEGGAILLFDEADALFGKRTEVRDSHDRYANIEVSYLLTRMESYRGLAILTTNLKSVLDTSFLRRIRFVVSFPFPDATQRMEIWRRVFPAATPTENLDVRKLAQLNIPGGNIRNIALHAAFLAADACRPVQMNHLMQAARSEYAKLEKPLTDSETAQWL